MYTVYTEIRASKTAESARSFPGNLIEKAPFTVSKALADDGKEFTDRFRATGQREPTGTHPRLFRKTVYNLSGLDKYSVIPKPRQGTINLLKVIP